MDRGFQGPRRCDPTQRETGQQRSDGVRVLLTDDVEGTREYEDKGLC